MLSVSVLAGHGADGTEAGANGTEATDVVWKPDQKVNWLPNHKTYGKPEESKEGWIVLGSHCFPYTPSSSKTNGMMNLRLELNGTVDESSIPETYEVMLYDDEPSGWPAFQKLPKDASCTDRKKLAKNYEKRSYTVTFQKQKDDIWAWNLPTMGMNEKTSPRFWYIILINCNGEKNEYKPILPLTYDFKVTDLAGFYNKLTGPTICYSTHTWDGLTQDGLVAGIVIFVLIDLMLAFFVRRHYKKMKAGRGHATIGQVDDDAENNLNLDDVNMLRSDTTRSDDM